jgi:peroxiredoxin
MSYKTKAKPKPKNSPLPLILAGAGLIIVSIAVAVFAPKETAPLKTQAINGPIPGVVEYPAPDLALVDLDGEPASLDDLRGQVVMVNNWATWCPPCRAEMPELEAYYQAHKDDGFVLVGINSGDQSSQVEAFIQEYNLTFPMWLDPTGLAIHAFKNNALPSSYILDEKGTVRLVWSGAVSLEALEAYVTPMLED